MRFLFNKSPNHKAMCFYNCESMSVLLTASVLERISLLTLNKTTRYLFEKQSYIPDESAALLSSCGIIFGIGH